MSKKPLLLLAATLVAAFVVAQTGSFTQAPQKKKIISGQEGQAVKDFHDSWTLKGRSKNDVRAEIASWANNHFKPTSETIASSSEQQATTPVLPLKLMKCVEFNVLSVPGWRQAQAAGYEESKSPSYHSVCLMRDSRGDLYNAVVESYDPDKESFIVQSVGPVLDRTPAAINLPIEKRRLKSWPSENTQIRLARGKGKPVLIPYPYPMNQMFFQYGEEPLAATFVSINTGKVYEGLDSILNEVDAQWQNAH